MTLTHDEIDVLQQSRFQAPIGWKWDYFINQDGARIRYGYVTPVKPKATIVIFSGIIESGENYFETVRDLLKYDYAVWYMDWRGQGGSDRYLVDRERAYSLGIDHDINDIDQFISTIISKHNNGRIFIIGHSWAGPAILLYLEGKLNPATAAILVAPAFSINNNIPAWLVTAVSSFQCKSGKHDCYAPDQGNWQETKEHELKRELFSHDIVRLQVNPAWLDKYPELRVGGATWAFVKEFQNACNRAVRPQLLNAISTPVLIISALKDEIANPILQHKISQQLPNGEYFAIKDARHALFIESDQFRDQVLEQINYFIERQLSESKKSIEFLQVDYA